MGRRSYGTLKTVRGDELKKWVDEYSLGRLIFSGEAAAVL
jgi:hypothetical protein